MMSLPVMDSSIPWTAPPGQHLPLPTGMLSCFVIMTSTYLYRPTILMGFALYYGQVFLAKFCFLQERGAYMALNNR